MISNIRFFRSYSINFYQYAYILQFVRGKTKCHVNYTINAELAENANFNLEKIILESLVEAANLDALEKQYLYSYVSNNFSGFEEIPVEPSFYVPPGNLYNVVNNTNDVASKARLLPGMNIRVIEPCNCWVSGRMPPTTDGKLTLFTAITHLNDKHRWTREKIADWLDELADAGTIDIEF